MSYLLIGIVALFMSACSGGSDDVTPYTLGEEIVVNAVLADPDDDSESEDVWNTVESSVTVADGPTSIGKIVVTLNLTHDGWLSDVNVALKSPSGTVVLLSDGSGVSEAGSFDVTLDDDALLALSDQNTIDLVGTFSPDEPLATFNGEDANGQWTLLAVDTYFGDGTGVLVSWSLDIQPEI